MKFKIWDRANRTNSRTWQEYEFESVEKAEAAISSMLHDVWMMDRDCCASHCITLYNCETKEFSYYETYLPGWGYGADMDEEIFGVTKTEREFVQDRFDLTTLNPEKDYIIV